MTRGKRPDPRLDRPVASRLPDDIGEAAQMRQAERMGVHVPVQAPVLSANGKNAGLGPFAKGTADTARAGAMENELRMSVSKVRVAAQKTTAMVSRPVKTNFGPEPCFGLRASVHRRWANSRRCSSRVGSAGAGSRLVTTIPVSIPNRIRRRSANHPDAA